MPMLDGLLEDARALLPDIRALRRELHAYPELGLNLPRTQQAVLDALAGLDLQITVGGALSSVTAVLEGPADGPVTLLRADMDALPIVEETGHPFASQIDGRMHACGHDAHTAMLVGAARLLHARRDQLRGRVIFMFQPGEEGFAGAKLMMDEGLLDHHDIKRAFAIHVTPMRPSGQVAVRSGPMLAANDRFAVTFTGRGGHASMPHDAVDPIPPLCEFVTATQTMLTRRVSVFDPAVVSVTQIQGGPAITAIPESTRCGGTIRTLSRDSRQTILDALPRLADHIAQAHGCNAVVEVRAGYPATINDADHARNVQNVARDLLGSDAVVEMEAPIMGSEDFAYVLERVKGAMAFLGTGIPGDKDPAPNHSSRTLLHEPALAIGAAIHAAVALT